MKEKMVRFLTSIGIENISNFDMDFDLIAYDMFRPKQLNMVIVKETPWDYSLLRMFIDHLANITYQYSISFSYSQKPTPNDVVNLFNDWYQELYRLPSDINIESDDKTVTFIFTNDEQKNKYESAIKDFIDFINFVNYEFKILTKEDYSLDKGPSFSEKEAKKIEKEAKQVTEEVYEQENNDKDDIVNKNDIAAKIEEEHRQMSLEVSDALIEIMERNKREMEKERERARRNKRGDYTPVDYIKDISVELGNVDFSATIFQIEEKTYRDSTILTLGVNDEINGTIKVIIRNNPQVDKDFIDGLKVKTNVRVRGCPYLDDYTGQLTIKGHFLNLLPPPEIIPDAEEEKRVELHLHSNMSTQDGVNDIGDYIKYAKALGHKALALTDHGIVQAFPDAQNAVKKDDFKVIYGCEFYMVDDQLSFIKNPSKTPLKNATYVVLDLETTGLSARYNTIIEFGAVKVKGLQETNFDLLIDPEIEIDSIIENLTGISNEMVKGKDTLEIALPKILDFIKDSILVTHNANFDFSFLQEACAKYGYPPLSNPVIDTLTLSRLLFPEHKFHNLGALCRNLEVEYDEESAHRADYDASVCNKVWQAMLERLMKDYGVVNHEDLDKIETPSEALKHIRPFHVVALTKNQAGIRDLYELVSLSHIKYFAGVPKLPRKELIRLRGNLLLGSACFNGEVFETARSYNEEKLKEVISFYDYIEVQPPENYSYLVNMGELSNDDIHKYINDIIVASSKVGKKVVATGDVHYLTKKEKIFRDVYISTLAVGKGRHPLNPPRRDRFTEQFPNPDQHYRSTKEMLECFSFLDKEKAYEIVVTNTNEIADSIEKVTPAGNDTLYTPKIEGCEDMLRDICYTTAHNMYGNPLPELIQNRLDRELNGIINSGYAVIYYLAHRLVKKSNDDGYIVGSRGSVGSSFVATMAGITEVNPLPAYYICPKCKKLIWGKEVHPDITCGYDLPDMNCPDCGTKMETEGQNIPFETFLGFEADKVPDIDLNFPRDYQATAHEYTKVLCGEHNVYRAGTIETVADKTAFGFASGYLEKPFISKYLKQGVKEDEAKSLAKKDVASKYPRSYIDYLASGCVNVKRTTGQHPGGIVVLPEGHEIYEFTPIQYPADDLNAAWVITHFDFEKIHDTLLKLDMLGHLDPMALKMMRDLTGISLKDIPFNDKKVLSLFSSAKALNMEHDYLESKTGAMGLPEFGTENTRRTLEVTKPQTFRDLVILSGLSHGTGVWQGNAEDLIKQGTATLQNVIACRDDIMTYLMSMDIPAKTAFTIMETVRKKNKFLTEEFIKIMQLHNVPQYYIDSCNKIEYLFPKGHATAYVIMAVRVAYFKLYYPLEFYATYFTVRSKQFEISTMIKGEEAIAARLDELKLKTRSKNDKMSPKESEIYKTLQLSIEMLQRGYHFANIDLYKSDATKFIVDKEHKALIPPFITLDGLGENNAITVVEARKDGEFFSKENLLKRTSLSQTNVNDLDKLGVLDSLTDSDQLSLFDL